MTQKTLAGRLVNVARANVDRPAIADSSGASLTYGEVLTRATGLANWLARTRHQEANIGIYLPSSVPAAISNFAITLSGKAAVNLNFTAGAENCRAAIGCCELRTILTGRTFVEKIGVEPLPQMVFIEDLRIQEESAAGLPEVDRDSTACILFSSGSTGVPKGIELTHRNIITNAEGFASRIPPKADDCMLGVLPFFHSFGYTFALWFPMLQGIRAVFHGSPTDAKTIGDLAEAHKATYFLSTPTFCQQYAQKIPRAQFSNMKYVVAGAEKLRDSAARQFADHFGFELLAGYGCTELGPGVAVNTPQENKPGSVGRPLPRIEVRIVDPETFEARPIGREGMILINGPSRMPGYYRSPELTARVMRDGFYITGDLGFLDGDGFLYVTDRIARFSKVAGEMAPHLRIEEAVSELTPSFVTGVADDRRGERLVLLYTQSDVTPDAIYRHLSLSKLPQLWIPKEKDIYPVPAIPVLPNGKVDLKHARELAASLAGH